MAWTTPRLWTTGELVTASIMNTHVRDNLAYLKGSAGTVAIDAGATIAGTLGVTGATTLSSTLAVTGAVTIAGGTAWHSGNDGSGSGLDADLLDGANLSETAGTGNTVVKRNSSGYILTNYLNMVADDQAGAIPFRIAGESSSDNFLRWFYPDFLDQVFATTTYDLGQASAATNARRIRNVRANGGTACTVSATGSAAIVIGTTTSSSTVIASGDSYSFYAHSATNTWYVI